MPKPAHLLAMRPCKTIKYRTGCEKQDANLQGAVKIIVEGCLGLCPSDDLTQRDMPDPERQGECGVAQRDGKHVGGEPEIVAQDGHKRVDRAIERQRLSISQDQ